MTTGNDLRSRLRVSTAAAHERMHGHAGLGAAAAGAISRPDYASLLSRLLGFHRAFDAILASAPTEFRAELDVDSRMRSPMIEDDLRTLGFDPAMIARLPVCANLYHPRDAAEYMGALYVVEGSTLGGVQLARAIAHLFDRQDGEGRRFFLGYGARNGAMWRDFLARLEGISGDAAAELSAMRGANQIFADFETWMAGWRSVAVPGRRDPIVGGVGALSR